MRICGYIRRLSFGIPPGVKRLINTGPMGFPMNPPAVLSVVWIGRMGCGVLGEGCDLSLRVAIFIMIGRRDV